MAGLTGSECEKLVEQVYFGAVMRQDRAAILRCFTLDATITILHGNAPPRTFKAAPEPGEAALDAFFEHLLSNFDAHFSAFTHYVDPSAPRCAARYEEVLSPKPDSPYHTHGEQHLRNCNFFEFREGKIHDMIIYYVDPSGRDSPTGFPKS